MPAPDAVLSFTVQGNFLTTNMVPPRLTIDGWPAPLPVTGTRKIPIWSGRHHLQVHSQWLRHRRDAGDALTHEQANGSEDSDQARH